MAVAAAAPLPAIVVERRDAHVAQRAAKERRVRGEQLGVNRREEEALPPRHACEVGEVLERCGEQFLQSVGPRVEDVRARLDDEGA